MDKPVKPKSVLVLFSYKSHKTGYYDTLFGPLKRREDEFGLHLEQGSLKDMIIEIIDNKLVITESMTGKHLDQFDYVRFEMWQKSPQQALAVASYLDRKGIHFSGHGALHVLCSTKIGELARMSDSRLPIPRTFMSSYSQTLKLFKSEQPPIPFPVVAKAADTYGGMMNYLVKDYSELRTALSAHKEQFFVIQEFIPNDCDYRFLVMGGQIKLIMKRTRQNADTHLNNTTAGASGEFVDIHSLPASIKADALKAAEKTLRSDFAGVDIMIDKNTGKHYVLEVNEAPAIQSGEQPEIKEAALLQHIKEMAYL